MEIAQVGVRTRARAALAMGAATSPPPTPKRRKINNDNNNNSNDSNDMSSNEERKFSTASPSAFIRLAASVVEPATTEAAALPEPATEERCSSPNSDEFLASCCCSNGSFGLDEDRIELSDLEVESAQVETSTCNCGDEIERREMSNRENSQELESVETNSRRPTPTAQNMPTESELEEFFAAAEKDIQKRFQDKYNYDIVKDVPLEGRYEWVELKP